jgi:hypothetical protein
VAKEAVAKEAKAKARAKVTAVAKRRERVVTKIKRKTFHPTNN